MTGKKCNRMSNNQRKAMFANLRKAGFTPLSCKFICRKANGEKAASGQMKVYSHPHWGLLMTNKPRDELDERYGKGWKEKKR